MHHRLRRRFWIEIGLALGASAVAILTVLVPQWIEIAFGFDPDEGNGYVELLITLLAAGTAVVGSIVARIEWRQRLIERPISGRQRPRI